ncbi:MAG: hypothetical protein E7115_07745 [Bacteroidales bacterium]|nr:hypothetical protein [Bacteroidales bacterium]
MKRIFILTVLMAVLGLTSCEKEPSKAIIGTWEAVKVEANVLGVNMNYNMSDLNTRMELTFKKDGTGTILTASEKKSETTAFEYSVTGDKLSLIEEGSTSGISVSFDKKTMTMELNGERFGLGNSDVKVHFVKK